MITSSYFNKEEVNRPRFAGSIKSSESNEMQRGTSVPFTLFAEMDGDLLWDSVGDVYLRSQARHTHVGWVRGNGDATRAAKAVNMKAFSVSHKCVTYTNGNRKALYYFTIVNISLVRTNNKHYLYIQVIFYE